MKWKREHQHWTIQTKIMKNYCTNSFTGGACRNDPSLLDKASITRCLSESDKHVGRKVTGCGLLSL